MDELTRAQMQLEMGIADDGSDLTDEQRANLEAYVAANGGQQVASPEQVAATIGTGGQSAETQAAPQLDPATIAAIQAAVGQAVGQAAPAQAAPQRMTFDKILEQVDPRDSDAALAMFEWLQKNSRLSVVATLAGGGGYLFHYAEPKGSSKAGYVPGSSAGGRMVDSALEKAEQQGLKKRDVGLCSKCFSPVVRLDDGTVALDDANDPSVTCTDGAAHAFQGV